MSTKRANRPDRDGLTLRQRLAVPVIVLALGLARAMVLTVPFRLYAPLLGHAAPDHDASPPPSKRDGRRAQRIGRLIETLAQRTPWTSNCFAQTIVAALSLRLLGIPYAVHFGVARPTGEHGDARPLEAHSWVMAGEHPVTGHREAQGMTCVRTFRRPA